MRYMLLKEGLIKRKGLVLPVIVLSCELALLGCLPQRVEDISDTRKAFIGMQKTHLQTCMGDPDNSARNGDIQVWTYNSITRGKSAGHCKVDIVLERGIVTDIDFSGDTGARITRSGICGSIVERCLSSQD